MKLNTNCDGWLAVLKDYQIVSMNYLWREDIENGSSRDVYDAVNGVMGENAISRASIINSLNMLVDEGLLTFHEITGKGGHRRIYKTAFDEEGSKKFLAQKFCNKLVEIFPGIVPGFLYKTLPMPAKE